MYYPLSNYLLISDFKGTGTLSGVAGVRIIGTYVNSGQGNVDIAAIGYNTNAVKVPEHISPSTFGFVLVLFFASKYLFDKQRIKNNKNVTTYARSVV